jgi:hypothetical protein
MVRLIHDVQTLLWRESRNGSWNIENETGCLVGCGDVYSLDTDGCEGVACAKDEFVQGWFLHGGQTEDAG